MWSSRGERKYFTCVEKAHHVLTTKQLRWGVHRSFRELVAAIREFIAVHNETGKPYVWVKTADEILASIARFPPRTLQAQPSELMARTIVTGH